MSVSHIIVVHDEMSDANHIAQLKKQVEDGLSGEEEDKKRLRKGQVPTALLEILLNISPKI